MALRIYNTLTREKEEFTTGPKGQGRHVPVRADGLQAESHRPHGRSGHLRCGQTLSDYLGYQVTFVVNITDVDDKLIVRTREWARRSRNWPRR